MLTLWGPGQSTRYCDGRSRRSFLKVGGLAMGGLGLPALLQADPEVTALLSAETLAAMFDDAYHFKHIDLIFHRVFGRG